MKKTALSLTTLLALSSAQNVTVPSTCVGETTAGRDVVIFTVPYTYTQVLSVIGSYKNLTWSGNPPDTVTLNGSDNTVGTARTYNTAGAELIETIDVYDSPPGGPYREVHTTALTYIPSLNISLYIPYDGTVVQSVCDGRATQFNFTANFCSDNMTAAGQIIHIFHYTDATTVGKFLGGQNFTSCEALTGSSNGTPTLSSTGPLSTYTGRAVRGSARLVWTMELGVGIILGAILTVP